jgi:hypothetical protein
MSLKYVNKRSDGGPVSDPTGYFADIDFPVFRLAEMYLIYAKQRSGAALVVILPQH